MSSSRRTVTGQSHRSRGRLISRRKLIQRVRRELERQDYPRLQMLMVVTITGGAGFLASFFMLQAGVETPAWRYGLAVAIAYVVFLLLLWLWLRTRDVSLEGLDHFGGGIVDTAGSPGDCAAEYQSGGGQFGGGGASSRWTDDEAPESLVELPSMPELPDVSVADADEAAIPIVVVLFVVGVVLVVLTASVSIIYSAPVLFAELLVDGALAATLYRRLRHLDSRHWLQSAIRRTVIPFAITGLLLMAAGWAISLYAPNARTIGEALNSTELRSE